MSESERNKVDKEPRKVFRCWEFFNRSTGFVDLSEALDHIIYNNIGKKEQGNIVTYYIKWVTISWTYSILIYVRMDMMHLITT